MNNVSITGRLVKDPELRKTESGLSTCSFAVAVDRDFKKKDDPNAQTADFPNVVAWRQTADYLCDYGAKGDMVEINGRLQTRSYQGKDGNRVFVTEIVADRVHLFPRANKQSETASTSTRERRVQKRSMTVNGEELDTESAFDEGRNYQTPEERVSGGNIDINPDELPFY